MRTCSAPGCDKKHLALGYCNAHYLRLQKTGSLGTAPVEARITGVETCLAQGCARESRSRGFCTMHYQRVKRHGSLKEPTRFREDVGYAAAHARMNREDPASNHTCACGARAYDWAYVGGAPDERLGVHGGVEMAYSLDPDFYTPMCRPCHRAFDSTTKQIAKRGMR